MAKISLTSYLIKIIDKKTNEQMKFNSLVDLKNNYTIIDILYNYFNSKKSVYSKNEENKKVITVIKNQLKDEKQDKMIKYKHITGIIQNGTYGYSSDIFNTDTGKVEYKKLPNSAEMLPFFYGIYMPQNANKGVCIFQRFMQYGIKSSLENDIKDYMEKNYPTIKIEMNPLFPKDYLKSFFEKGSIKQLKFIKHGVAKDIADRIDGEGFTENVGFVEYIFKAKRRKNLPVNNKIWSMLNEGKNVTEMFEITNFKYDNIKVEISINNVTKTINMNNIESINGSYNVTDDLTYGENGHPTYKSISSTAKEYAESFLISLGLLFLER
ncbi:hypothetical protein IAI10_09960 [Clostridium sp. 19966]|uniref:hypothetical protein n=1 Tax=Clostridium sp. 19966 TaxID=2768166 RepID=UPI0028DDBE3A|nr:hypothetical protein [Clostridium sp. 19966]MDT8716982.1 hypothetical protein [Clostridium sp. 19966]